jgi:HK97 family phage prohead protease
MELPAGLFVSQVPNSDDIVAFNFGFQLEGKSADDPIVEELEDGDLLIEGWAAEFDGVDRQGENFMDGAFQRGIKSFLSGAASLCFNHQHEKVLGKVLDLEEVEGKGLRMRARVDGAIKDHPELGVIYNQIKKGTLSALSVGGFFKRQLTVAGTRISDMDFTEISVTGVPVHSRPAFSVIAGKALEGTKGPEGADAGSGDALIGPPGLDYGGITASLDNLSAALDVFAGDTPSSEIPSVSH